MRSSNGISSGFSEELFDLLTGEVDIESGFDLVGVLSGEETWVLTDEIKDLLTVSVEG